MAKGEQFPAEWRSFTDDQTGVTIRQLTAYKGHSHHLYFTNPGWYDGGRKLLFGSDRGNRTNLFGVQLVFYYGLALVLALWYVLSHTPLGRYLYFVGEGRNVARLSGIRVDAIRVGALIAGSTISAAAGVFQAGLIGGADPTIGPTLLLPAFAAAFLGATAIVPGRFNPWGTFIAVYFLATGIVGLQLIGLSGWIEQVFYGAALILAVAASRIASKRDRPAWLSRTARIRPNTPAKGDSAA